MGTGPFTFVEHVAGSHWSGRRFEGYFEKGKPHLNGFLALFYLGRANGECAGCRRGAGRVRGHSPADRDRIVKRSATRRWCRKRRGVQPRGDLQHEEKTIRRPAG